MSLAADFDLKERVRMTVDIVDLIGSHLELRPQGRAYVARCPWHDDRRPSLQVNPQRQTWKCWVCDIGGDIFSYVMQRDGVEFPEAVRILADKAGIDHRPVGQRAAAGSPEDKAALLAAVRFAATAYYEYLENDPGAAAARQYLAARGIDQQSRQRFLIGYAPDAWSWLMDEAQRAGFSGDVLQAAGLAAARKQSSGHYDLFRGRLMFPIVDLQERPIALGGRILPGADPDKAGAKYINGPETRLFSKSRQLYGLNLARTAMQNSGMALVMEGYTDVIAAHQAGMESAVAVLGTALGQQHVTLLRRFVDSVVLVLDGDEAGRRRADQVLELFVGSDIDLRVATLPGGADPADYISAHGREPLERLVAEAPDALDHKLGGLIDGVDLTHDTHRANTALRSMLDIIARGHRPGDLRTLQLLLRLSRLFSVPEDDLRRQLQQRTGALRRRSTTSRIETAAERRSSASRPPLEPLSGLDRELLEIMIEYPETASRAIELVDPAWLTSATARQLLQLYQDLELAGRDLNLETVMLAIDDERFKTLLVGLDESIQQRSRYVTQPVSERFSALVERFHLLQAQADSRLRLTRIEAAQDVEGALDVLGDIIAARRQQQGLRPK